MNTTTIQAPSIHHLAELLGVAVQSEALWLQALTHPSYVNENPEIQDCYERLEFLGDAILGTCVAQLLFDHDPLAPPGHLTFLRSILVRKENLAKWAKTLPIQELIRLGKGAPAMDQRGEDSVLSDVAEALLAVMYLENGLEPVKKLIRDQVAAEIPTYEEARAFYEPKNVLQEKLAAKGLDAPSYEVVAEDDDTVTVAVAWHDTQVRASGRSKKEAGVLAARMALLEL